MNMADMATEPRALANPERAGPIRVRDLIKLIGDGDLEMDDYIFVVSDKAIVNEYQNDDDSPSIIYAPQSWQEVRRAYVDMESGFDTALLLVFSGSEEDAEEADDEPSV